MFIKVPGRKSIRTNSRIGANIMNPLVSSESNILKEGSSVSNTSGNKCVIESDSNAPKYFIQIKYFN